MSNILGVKPCCNTVEKCSFVDSLDSGTLQIPFSIWAYWLYKCTCLETEWLEVFWVKDNVVEKLVVPKQKVGKVSAEMFEDLGGNGIIHSHNGAGTFHSSTDDKEARPLYDWSIVINEGDYTASRKQKLPCGHFGFAEVSIELLDAPDIHLEKMCGA